MKKMLLVNYGKIGENHHFPMSLAFIAAALKRESLKFDILDCFTTTFEQQKLIVLEKLTCNNYHSIGFTTYLGNYSFRYFHDLSLDIKKNFPKINIVYGGPMASSVYDIVLKHGMADVVAIGEGELSAPAIADALASDKGLKNVPGIAYLQNGQVVRNPSPPRIKNLDELYPLPYELFPMDFYINHLKNTNRCFGILGSRGCYSKCNFCYLTYGKKMTFRTADSIAKEMQSIYDNYGIKKFNFLDDNFLSISRLGLDLCKKIKTLSFKPLWRYQARVDKINQNDLREFVNNGLIGITLGIESGSNKILKAMNKEITTEQATNAISLCRENKVEFSSNFIIGFPEDTEKSIEETKTFMDSNQIFDNTWVGYLVCYPDTPIYEFAKSIGVIKNEIEYLSGLGPSGKRPYVNISRWSDEDLMAKRDYLLEGRNLTRAGP